MADPALSYRNVGDEDSWPLLLVGPILRRVTPSSVAVFVATSRNCEVTLQIFDESEQFVKSASGITYTLGKRLHVLVVEATGLQLEQDHTYKYDVHFDDGSQDRDLKDLGLLDGSRDAPLGYGAGKLPGFVLPRKRDKLKIIHMSCRKPHGGGPDMLPTVDKKVAETHDDPDARPQQLLLTGDQIYADDVSPALLHNLKAIGHALLDWDEEEKLPDRDGNESYPDTHEKLALGMRDRFLEESGVKKATEYSVNHLLYFREWCAMYVMAWSDALWLSTSGMTGGGHEDLLSQWQEASNDWKGSFGFNDVASGNNDVASANYILTPCEAFPSEAFPRGFEETTPAVLRYAHYIQRTRRVLANVPTYMIFDDHEITDDWFLNGRMNLQFRCTPLGRRLMRNGLMAYAIFQDWGNHPEQYDPTRLAASDPGHVFWEAVAVGGTNQTLSTPGNYNPKIARNPGFLDDVLDVGKSALGTGRKDERLRWDFFIDGPEHRILFMDTRTWRHFPDEQFGLYDQIGEIEIPLDIPLTPTADEVENELGEGHRKLNAWLIGDDAQELQLDPALNGFDARTQTLFVVSAAPVFNSWTVEMGQRLKILAHEIKRGSQDEGGDTAEDNEPWIGNPTALEALLNRLSIGVPIIFLSGDVHYAFTSYNVHRPPTGLDSQAFVQLCSSSGKNATKLTRAFSALTLMKESAKNFEWYPSARMGTDHVAQVAKNFFDKFQSLAADTQQDPLGTALDIGDQKWRELERLWWRGAHDLMKEYEELSNDPWKVQYGYIVRLPLIADQMQGVVVNAPNVWKLFAEGTQDDRGAERFEGEAKDWYDQKLSPKEKRYWERMGISSVGHTNVGFIVFDGDHVVHDLLWYNNSKLNHLNGFHLVTRHRCDLANPPDPDSWGGGG